MIFQLQKKLDLSTQERSQERKEAEERGEQERKKLLQELTLTKEEKEALTERVKHYTHLKTINYLILTASRS